MDYRRLRLRYAAVCAHCGDALKQGTYAWWHPTTKVSVCLLCAETSGVVTGDPFQSTTSASVAGASAMAEYERRANRDRERNEARPFGKLRRALAGERRTTAAWHKGAQGETRLAEFLQRIPDVRAMHDRRIPGSRANVDHLVVAASGVWIIDSKNYSGRLERRGDQLWIGGRNRSNLANGLTRQVDAVRDAVDAATPLHPALCLLGVDWPLTLAAFAVEGVAVHNPRSLRRQLSKPGPLGRQARLGLATQLDAALPPA